MPRLIFCQDCHWLDYRTKSAMDSVLEALSYDCRYPENVTIKTSWLCSTNVYERKPSEINAANDCRWFKSLWKENK